MSGVATAIGGAALIGYVAQTNAANSAAGAQRDASNAANATAASQYNQTREDQTPWRDAGGRALSQMEGADFQQTFNGQTALQNDPGYQFRLAEGNKAINASASARGMANSGATMKALTRYGQDYASNEYQNAYNRFNNDQSTRFNRLASLAGIGQTANNTVANAGANMSNQISNNTMASANASSAAMMANANSLSQMAGTGANAWMNYQMMNRFSPQPAPSTGYSGQYLSPGGSSSGTGMLGANTSFYGG